MKIEELLTGTIESLKNVIDADNAIGSPIITKDNGFIIPISKISCGFLTGGGEYSETNPKSHIGSELPHAGGSGGGVSINPVGFLICNMYGNEYISIDKCGGDNKWSDLIQASINLMRNSESK